MNILEYVTYTSLFFLFLSSSLTAQSFSEIEPGKNGIPDATWPRIYFNSFDKVISALEILPLRDMEPVEQFKEIRIWTGVSIGAPKSLYIISKYGDRVDGKLILYWNASDIDRQPEGETFHDLMIYNLSGSCENFTLKGRTGYCIASFEYPPNWENFYNNASELGLWDLPDESELPSEGFILDGWGLVVELLDDNQYRTYNYSNPDKRDWPEAALAVEINAIITSARQHMKTSNVRKIFKGITSGEYRSAFKECDSDEIWAFRASIVGLAKRSEIELPEPGEYGYLVEVFGTPTPEWLAIRWKSDFIRELQMSRLISIEPANSPNCK